MAAGRTGPTRSDPGESSKFYFSLRSKNNGVSVGAYRKKQESNVSNTMISVFSIYIMETVSHEI